MAHFTRLVRFVPQSDLSRILIGQPVEPDLDVGLALRKGLKVTAFVFSGSSVLAPGSTTSVVEVIDRILSPLASNEVGTIRCIGLNYKQHAAEVKLEIPATPTVFMKPNTSLGTPWPEPTILPKVTQADDCGDYEAELAVVIGKTAKNVSAAEAMDYVLGYTAANDVSSRTSQFAQSQWCYSKSFDGACPLGPALVSTSVISDPASFHLRGLKNGEVLQDCGIDFLSQSTTLPPGTVILTGTPAGVGAGRSPKVTLRENDEFEVEILPHIGTLVNLFKNEK